VTVSRILFGYHLLLLVMASTRKSDDMKMVAADRNEILARSGGNSKNV